ncbi:Pet117p PWA37_005355 [Arxiozyma heterogenica]|uniref:Pet117p n=1 Tax=Arxiozyma heterogenica TaxID=278026 RepID=UPI002EDFD404
MSRASKITFGLTCLFTLTSIIGVHYVQELERDTLHQGPIKDAKRIAEKKKKETEEKARQSTENTSAMKPPTNGLSPEEKEKKRNFNRSDHELQQQLRQKYEKMQPLTGEIVTKDGELVQSNGKTS